MWSLLRASAEVTRRARTQAVGNLTQWRLGGLECSASGEELLCFVLDAIVVDMECVEKLGLITVQRSRIPEPCAALDRVSACHPVVRCTFTRAQSGLH